MAAIGAISFVGAILVGLLVFLAIRLRQLSASHREVAGEYEILSAQLEQERARAREVSLELKERIETEKKIVDDLRSAKSAAENAAQAKSEFLATMSHEIRTPMNGVLGMVELLQSTELSDKQKRFADTIRRSGEALLAIINDVLDFSKIEAGRLEIQHTVFDLRQLLEDVGSLFAERAIRKKLDLTCFVPVDEHVAYRGDPERIRQILTNLIGNALKFTESGEIRITATAQTEMPDDQTLIRIEVVDTGIGIKPENQGKIFDSFQQADGSTTRKFGGTGLGLAICSQLTRLMNGDIGVESDYGHGSTFWFTVELKKMPASSVVGLEAPNKALNERRALVIDSSHTNREHVIHQLEAWGMRCVGNEKASGTSRTLADAAKAGDPFDILIVDKNLIDGDGLSVARSIRQDRSLNALKIILMSSIHNLDETGNWFSAGIDCYLNKPIRQVELLEAIRTALDLTRASKRISAEAPDVSASQPSLSAHVLIAEDNPVNQALVTSILDRFECSYFLADNGQAAYEAIAESPMDHISKPYDLILMDCQMPILDGFETTQAIRDWEKNSGANAIPIIALTANAMEGDREHCLAAGMNDYLTKPFKQEELRQILVKWLPISTERASTTPREKDRTSAADSSDDRKEDTNPPILLLNEEEIFGDLGKSDTILDDTVMPLMELDVSVPEVELDRSAIDALRQLETDGSEGIFAKMVTLFMGNSPPLLQKIEDSVATRNPEGLRYAAHTLKSSSAQLGAMELSETCKALEAHANDQNFQDAIPLIGQLESQFEAASRALSREVVSPETSAT